MLFVFNPRKLLLLETFYLLGNTAQDNTHLALSFVAFDNCCPFSQKSTIKKKKNPLGLCSWVSHVLLLNDIFHSLSDRVGRQKAQIKFRPKIAAASLKWNLLFISSHLWFLTGGQGDGFKMTKGFRFRPLSLSCYHSTKVEKWSRLELFQQFIVPSQSSTLS